jgi:microcystin-dependent protein
MRTMGIDFFPIGAIAPCGGTLENNNNWFPCDGRSLHVDDYPELFNAIGYTYGGSDENKLFTIPDCRGYFLRGSGDTHPLGTIQEYATGKPKTDIKGQLPHYPTSHTGSHGITSRYYAGYEKTHDIETCTKGGDGDTRPVNVYVNFYIKVR